jgi:CheY-like chemotaxis protein
MPLSKEAVSLSEVILECKAMIEPLAKQQNIKLTLPLFEVPYFVVADRVRLKQVFINLLSNAIKYNRPNGTIVVACTNILERTRISITDTGFGLSPEKIDQLFQAFNRLGRETNSEEGTGIGLVVSKRMVELMGGTIGVESTVGVGSVFWFELVSISEPKQIPMEKHELSALSALPLISNITRLSTLLYVEDNPANLKLVEQIIERHPNMNLLTATNGNTGVQLARKHLPDVILMDINLPGINGFEALEILKHDSKTAHIPIIAVSANAMPSDIKKGIDAGFFRYITKPIRVNELMVVLNLALESLRE